MEMVCMSDAGINSSRVIAYLENSELIKQP